VELKTSVDPATPRDVAGFERKLLKFWLQSFLLGVPKIIVGFRDQEGILRRIEELETAGIPGIVKRRGGWDGNVAVNFGAAVLECEFVGEIGRRETCVLIGDRFEKDDYIGWRVADSETGEESGCGGVSD
jgi:RAT1-interacting protein